MKMVHSVQPIIDFEPTWLANVNINLRALETSAARLSTTGGVTGNNKKAWALKALTLTDLTTLAGDDTKSNVTRLCHRAAKPLTDLSFLREDHRPLIHTAAVCVYPSRVKDAYAAFVSLKEVGKIQIAAVATGFPTGQYPLKSRLEEITFAIESGANEIDIVLDRSLVLNEKWEEIYCEVKAMRMQCGDKAHMKTILAIGECGTMENVYKASMVAMMAGSDFIKTSTGKEGVNATLPVGLLMIRAIQDFYERTGRKIGLKPAGGVRTTDDAIKWMTMIKETLGSDYLQPTLFRFGASGLLDDIVKVVEE